MDYEIVLQAIEVTLVSSTSRVSGKFSISQSSVVCVMVPNLQTVMNSSVTINTGLCTYSWRSLGSQTDFKHFVHMLYYTSLIYFVPCKLELCYSSGPFTGPQQFVTFMTLLKASKAAKLCDLLPKYCKTFDLLLYM